MDNKEIARRERIRASLLSYYQTDKGIVHKRNLSEQQAKRMAEYSEYLNNKLTKK